MDTMSLQVATGVAIGARHVRADRNGQDAAASWVANDRGAIVVCDGCGAGASSEVGARLGAELAIAAIADQLRADVPVEQLWPGVRARVGAALEALTAAMPGPRERVVHDYFLFTIVAAAVHGDRVAVWALGDGGYALGTRVVELGPFPDNQPPYLGYDLLGAPLPAHLEVTTATCGAVAVATDGALEVGLAGLVEPRCFANRDRLRRNLVTLARSTERIDWTARRVERSPASLQDDGAVAALRWSVPS